MSETMSPEMEAEAAEAAEAMNQDKEQPKPPFEPNIGKEMAQKIARVFAQASKQSLGVQVEYLFGSTIIPNQMGQPAPAFFLTLAMPSLLIGQKIHGTAVITDLWGPEEALEGQMVGMISQLLQAREDQAMEAAKEHATAKGAVEGLILP